MDSQRTVTLDASWLAVEAIHGGYAVGLLASRLPATSGYTPMSLTAHFFGSVRPGPATVSADTLHLGTATGTVTATLIQAYPRLHVLAKVTDRSQPELQTHRLDLSSVAGPGAAPAHELPYQAGMGYHDLVDTQLVDTLHGSVRSNTRGWVRVHRHPSTEALVPAGLAAITLDLIPSGSYFDARTLHNVPTIDMTLHLSGRQVLVDEWYFIDQHLEFMTADYCVDSAIAYTCEGIPVAAMRQSRRIVPADAPTAERLVEPSSPRPTD